MVGCIFNKLKISNGVKISRKKIDRWAIEAVRMAPKRLLKRMHNLVFVIDDRPTRSQVKECRLTRGYALLGLYQGFEQTNRLHAAVPDKISLFRNAIMEGAKTVETIRRRVYKTTWHEISHHFGSDEAGALKAEKRMFEKYARVDHRTRVQKKEVRRSPQVEKRRRGYKRKTRVTYVVRMK